MYFATRRAILYQGAVAAASDWWLSGGISAANAIAAYQPKGAAGLAASYTNLANPGTYDVAPGVAPTLDANGWNFTGTQYLDTSVVFSEGYTIIARGSFSSIASASYWIGGRDSTTTRLQLGQNTGPSLLNHGGSLTGATLAIDTEYVMAQAGGTGYVDSSSQGTSGAWSGTNEQSLYIGGDNNNGSFAFGCSGYVCAVAIYDTTLTAGQVSAVSTAMAAL